MLEDENRGSCVIRSGEQETSVLFEEYLDRVYAPLVASIPLARRREMRVEIEEHLHALKAAYQELNLPLEAAAAKALAQFGEPEVIANELLREWAQHSPISRKEAVRQTTLLALPRFSMATLAALLLLYVSTVWTGIPGVLLVGTLWGVLPLLTGLNVGYRAIAQPVHGTIGALILLALPISILYLRWARSFPYMSIWREGIIFLLIHLVTWFVFGIVGATSGNWLHGTSRKWKRGNWKEYIVGERN